MQQQQQKQQLASKAAIAQHDASALSQLNTTPVDVCEKMLFRICASSQWCKDMAALRPFVSLQHLLSSAIQVDTQLSSSDWLEAFRGHPKVIRQANKNSRSERHRHLLKMTFLSCRLVDRQRRKKNGNPKKVLD